MLLKKRHREYFILIIMILSLWSCNQVDTAVSDAQPSCFDGILNQGEFEVDCGGPCLPCDSKLTANINGMNWESIGAVTTQVNNNAIFISAGNANSTISLIYTGPFVNGTFPLNSALYSVNATGTNYTSNTGTISFVQWDNVNNIVFGTFNFKAFEATGTGDSVVVNQGTFSFVPF